MLLPESMQAWFDPSARLAQMQLDQQQLSHLDRHGDTLKTYALDNSLDLASLQQDVAANKLPAIRLELSQRHGLRRELRLPVAAEKELDTILRFEIDRQTPFSADQVYAGYEILSRDKADKTLIIQLDVVPRRVLDPILAQLEQAGCDVQEAILEQADHSSPNLITQNSKDNEGQWQKQITGLLLLLVLGLIAVNVYLPFHKLNQSMQVTESAIQQSRKDAMEVNNLRGQWEADQARRESLREKMHARITSPAMLDELTRLIPDDTYLTRIQLREPSITIQGESANATQLISLLDASELFSETRFQSPVTTNISTGKERFQISMQLNTEAAAAP